MEIHIKRVYDPPSPDDGLRVLVDRLWPRGLKKEDATIDVWAKDLAPSTNLRKWFSHDAGRFEEFAGQYRDELRQSAADLVRIGITASRVALLYAARSTSCNHAVVLQSWLLQNAPDAT